MAEEPVRPHALLAFHCNYTPDGSEPCNHVLDEGWITECAHLLCTQHAREWFGAHDDCPICRDGKVKLVRMDLSRASVKKRGRMALIGMTPPEIIRTTETALNFWVDQKVFEFRRTGEQQDGQSERQRKMEEDFKAKLTQAEAACGRLDAERRELQEKIQAVEKDNGAKHGELQSLKRDLADAEERHRNMQRQAAVNAKPQLLFGASAAPPAAQPHPHHDRQPQRQASPGAGPQHSFARLTGARPTLGETSTPTDFFQCLQAHSQRPHGQRAPPSASAFGAPARPLGNQRLPFMSGLLDSGRPTKRRVT